ncbi:MAG: hypothetical protein ACD_80C00027G0004 [uncultured bacterium (gcode 4)]|uniref:VWFA domain-containing protein n=1 Tax=uncultured bacterium (gcode 4) TaxID=1234023 RepID=K1X5P1_9BACT|nr:MAG: hypothetical protein ACD_80C00027G0004 [uncultured bacterium (gcode 4)]
MPKLFIFIKFLLLIIALSLASFLMYSDSGKQTSPDQKIVFVLDINRTMNTKDVFSGTQQISRLQAAKSLIHQQILSDSQFSYGLILFNQGTDYIIPPTFDTWTFLLYLSGITTNLLPDWPKSFAQLSWLLVDTTSTSYLIISDFDAQQEGAIKLPQWVTLLGLWSLAGDKVRYSNGIVYYDNGKSVFSARNDQFAQSLNASYTSVSQIADISVSKLLSHGYALPVSQRIFLYALLGVLVILVVML